MTISSKQNDKIKFVVKLRDRSKRKRFGMFIVEGFRELERALDSNINCEFLFFCPTFFKTEKFEALIKRAHLFNIPAFEVTPEVFKKISGREGCDGILGVCRTWETILDALTLSKNPLLLVVDGIEKSGNLGALIRSAESVGVDAMIVCNPITDIFNQNVVRVSQGALFSLPIVIAERAVVRDFLLVHGITIFATTPVAHTRYWEVDLEQPSAIIVGSEHAGLPDYWLSGTHVKTISIPQCGRSDSLNVNDAAVIILYDAIRQRTLSINK